MSSKKQSFTRKFTAIVVLCWASVIPAFANCGPSNGKGFTAEMVLERLRDQRDKFIREGKFADVFPALYYATTKAMLDETRSMDAADAQVLNEQIALFFNAFETNRLAFESKGASAVEPHWKAYYSEAVRLEKKKATAFEAITLILDGVDAHLTDLPRSIRYQIRSRPNSTERLKMLYFGFDSLFPAIVRAFDADVAAAFGKRGIAAPPFTLLNVGANYVIRARHNAWEVAVGSEKLRTKKPQPTLCKEK